MLHYCRIQTGSSIYQELPDFSIKMRTHFCATDCSPLEGVSRYRFMAPPAGRVTPPFACQPSITGTTSQNNLTQRVTVYSLHILPYTDVSASRHFPALISTTVSYLTFYLISDSFLVLSFRWCASSVNHCLDCVQFCGEIQGKCVSCLVNVFRQPPCLNGIHLFSHAQIGQSAYPTYIWDYTLLPLSLSFFFTVVLISTVYNLLLFLRYYRCLCIFRKYKSWMSFSLTWVMQTQEVIIHDDLLFYPLCWSFYAGRYIFQPVSQISISVRGQTFCFYWRCYLCPH